ncbi:MAG: PAS domain-containing protein [Pseudomonadota bacterium]
MANDERLREALLELRTDRDRAVAASTQAEALLHLSEALAGAANRSAALSLLVQETASFIEGAEVLVVEPVAGGFMVCASAAGKGTETGNVLALPIDPTRKPRNFLDLAALGPWSEIVAARGWRSLLIAPLEIDQDHRAAILCAHPDKARFRRVDAALLRRISKFASQTLTKLALTSQTQLLGAVIDGSSSGFAIADAHRPDKPLIFVNKAFEQLTGYSSDEVLGSNCRLLSAEDPDSEERTRLRKAVAENGSGRFLLRNRHKSGREFWNDLNLFPVRNDAGDTEFLVATQTDASDRIRDREERERVKEQEAMAQLAAGIAHDFNNLLSAINGSALLISTAPDVTDEIETHAARISQAGGRAAKLVSRMLDLGSRGGDYHDFEIKEPIREAIDLSRSSLGDGITLSINLDPADCRVHGSTTEITQILVNLLLNARDALPDAKGQIAIALGSAGDLPKVANIGAFDAGRDYVQLTLRDTGTGMSDLTLSQIFEPYFTTKGAKGKGIGLSMVVTLIKKLDAVLKVTSKLGDGTRFDIWFPRVQTPDAQNMGDLSVLAHKTVLIVDDEEEPAQVLASYLSRLGAEPSVLTLPALALEILEEDHAEWDAVVTDYDMPDMSGGDLVGAVRRFAPDLPMFVVTALARRLDDRRLIGGAVQGVWEKPLDLKSFAATLAGHLAPDTAHPDLPTLRDESP